MNHVIAWSLSRGSASLAVDLADRLEQDVPALEEERVEHLVLGAEVVVDEPVGDARLVGDVATRGGVEALAREDADRGVEDDAGACPRRAALARPSGVAVHARRRRAAVRERGQLARGCASLRGRGRGRRSRGSRASGAWARTTPQGSTIISVRRTACRRRARRSGWRRRRTPAARSPARARGRPSGRGSWRA